MINWKPVLLFGGILVLFIIVCIVSTFEDIDCKKRGGRATRIGGVNPNIFMDTK